MKNGVKKKAKAGKKDEGKSITIRPRKGNEDLKEKLQVLAGAKVRSLNEFCERILEEYIKNPTELYN